MLVNSPLQSRHATPQRKSTPKRQGSPSLMQYTPITQVIEKSRQSAPIRSRQETPITVRQQTPLSTRKVTPIRSISPSLMQTSYPPTPTPNAYGKSPISDKSNILSISDPTQNLPEPPIKRRGRPAAKQHDYETPEQYNARTSKNEKAVIARKRIKELLKEFNVIKAKELEERLTKLNEPLKTSSKSSPAKIKKSN